MENNEKNKLILADLYDDKSALKLANVDQLNGLLNTPPNEKWVKVHPSIKNHAYLPIDKVEFLLKRIFKLYRIEVIKTGMLLNSVEVTVRVHYLHPVLNEWQYHDGVGAAELQTASGTGPLKLDMSNVNKGAVPMALPIAKSYAIKDACDHLGTVFGADLNRKDTLSFTPDEKLTKKSEQITKELTSKIPA